MRAEVTERPEERAREPSAAACAQKVFHSTLAREILPPPPGPIKKRRGNGPVHLTRVTSHPGPSPCSSLHSGTGSLLSPVSVSRRPARWRGESSGASNTRAPNRRDTTEQINHRHTAHTRHSTRSLANVNLGPHWRHTQAISGLDFVPCPSPVRPVTRISGSASLGALPSLTAHTHASDRCRPQSDSDSNAHTAGHAQHTPLRSGPRRASTQALPHDSRATLTSLSRRASANVFTRSCPP